MRVIIQRVKNAKVEVSQETVGAINHGLVVLLGIEMADTLEDVLWTVKKVTQLRIFSDLKILIKMEKRRISFSGCA